MVTVMSRVRADWPISANMTACRGIAREITSIDTSVVVTIGRVGSVTDTMSSVPSGPSEVASINTAVIVAIGRVGGVAVAITNMTETCSICATSDVLGNTLELIITLLTSCQSTTLSLELVHGHGGESSGLVVSGSVVMNLMDGNSGMDDIGLNGLLLDNRLDGLVNVMMYVLTTNGGCDALALSGAFYTPLILELSLLLDKISLGRVVVAVIKLAMLNGTKLGRMLLWQNLAVLYWLNSAMIVILVDLLVYCRVDLFMLVRLDRLVSDRRSNCLMDSGVMMS